MIEYLNPTELKFAGEWVEGEVSLLDRGDVFCISTKTNERSVRHYVLDIQSQTPDLLLICIPLHAYGLSGNTSLENKFSRAKRLPPYMALKYEEIILNGDDKIYMMVRG